MEERLAGCLSSARQVAQQASLFGATGHGCRPVGRVLLSNFFCVGDKQNELLTSLIMVVIIVLLCLWN